MKQAKSREGRRASLQVLPHQLSGGSLARWKIWVKVQELLLKTLNLFCAVCWIIRIQLNC